MITEELPSLSLPDKLNEINIVLEGNLAVARKYSKEQAKDQLPKAKNALFAFSELSEVLEFISYLDSKTVEQQAISCLDLVYQLETLLKKNAFSADDINKTSEDLKEALAIKSKEAIQKALSN